MEGNKYSSPTLRDILDDPDLLVAFKSFLKKLHSRENLDFWLEVEAFRKNDKDRLKSTANDIIKKYVAPDAPFQLNVDHSLIEELNFHFLSNEIQTSFFDNIQEAVYTILELDSCRKFVQSEEFKKITGMNNNINISNEHNILIYHFNIKKTVKRIESINYLENEARKHDFLFGYIILHNNILIYQTNF